MSSGSRPAGPRRTRVHRVLDVLFIAGVLVLAGITALTARAAARR
jgi:hypothetical protein